MSVGIRFPREKVEPVAQKVLAALAPHAERIQLCGSLRRGKDVIGDVDIVMVGGDPDPVMAGLGYPRVTFPNWNGPRHEYDASREGIPLKVDVWVMKPRQFAAACMYTTGPCLLNVVQRRWARYKGLKLTLYGIRKDGKTIPTATEEDCYRVLGWPYLTPEERNRMPEWLADKLHEMNEAVLRGDFS